MAERLKASESMVARPPLRAETLAMSRVVGSTGSTPVPSTFDKETVMPKGVGYKGTGRAKPATKSAQKKVAKAATKLKAAGRSKKK